MPSPALPALLALAVHTAGTVRVETTVATEVQLEGLPIVKTYGPGSVSLPDVKAGVHAFEVFRYGSSRSITVQVPTEGTVRLLIGEESVTTDTPPPTTPGTLPILRFEAATGQRFSIMVDGKRVALLHPGQPVLLEALGVGHHDLQIRSVDNLTVWSRGSLELQPGDDLRISLAEGRLPEVFGRPEAWRPR
jgi:hypothetical protein